MFSRWEWIPLKMVGAETICVADFSVTVNFMITVQLIYTFIHLLILNLLIADKFYFILQLD